MQATVNVPSAHPHNFVGWSAYGAGHGRRDIGRSLRGSAVPLIMIGGAVDQDSLGRRRRSPSVPGLRCTSNGPTRREWRVGPSHIKLSAGSGGGSLLRVLGASGGFVPSGLSEASGGFAPGLVGLL
jgi:hypothetical protein